jgi:hypothetical protein
MFSSKILNSKEVGKGASGRHVAHEDIGRGCRSLCASGEREKEEN